MARGTALFDGNGNFVWDDKRDKAAIMLAQHYTKQQICDAVGIDDSTLYRWEQIDQFNKEVDKLALMHGVASKAHRLKLLNKAIRQMIDENDEIDLSGVSFIDLIKEARMQAEGMKLDVLNTLIPAFAEETGSVAGGGSDGSRQLLDSEVIEAD